MPLDVPVPPTVPPMRPPMPTPADQMRALRQTNRYALMSEDFEDLLISYMEPRVGADRLAQWGPPDTSADPLAELCRQFSTPGLYGSRPTVSHQAPVAQEMVGAGGWLDLAGLWTAMQTVQYLTLGMGDWPVHYDATPEDGITLNLVCPADIWVWSTQDRPDVPVVLWWLRQRPVTTPTGTRWTYAWDQWDLGERAPDGEEIRLPSFRVVEAGGIHDGMDITNLVIRGAPIGGYVGADYRWRKATGRPFLPWVIYRAVDSKKQWNTEHKLGATRGSLNAATHWTYAGHCARDASGTAVIAAGLVPIMGNVQNAGEKDKIQTVSLSPGAILYHQTMDNAQPFVQEVGPGGNLKEVSEFAHAYELKQLSRWGISADDVQKTSADPASGAALYISNQAKRQYAAQVRPLFERGDLEALSICAALLRLAGLGDYPETGYSITYAEIPRSAAEMQAARDQTDWDLEHGHISEVEAYMRSHPGAREDDAIAALTKAAVDTARLERAKADAIAAAGLAPKSVQAAPLAETADPEDDPDEEDPEDVAQEPGGEPPPDTDTE